MARDLGSAKAPPAGPGGALPLNAFGAFSIKITAFCGLQCEQQFYFYSYIFTCCFFVEIAAVWAILIIIKHACEDPEIVSRDVMGLEAEPLEF